MSRRPGRPGPFLGRPIELFSVGGIGIAIHPSWFVVAAGISIIIRLAVVDNVAGALGIVAAVGVMLIFYSFVLLHELAHSLVARRHGLEPKRIVLFLLGGVSQIDREATRPSHEYQVALAGPLVSLILAGLLFAASRLLDRWAVSAVADWLAWLNLLLAAFNLVPGFPLDGGRVLRSALWAISGDRPKATRIAAAMGKLVAVALMAGGVAGVLTIDRDGRQYAPFLVVVGWFLYSMAGAAAAQEGAYPAKPEPEPEPAPVPEPEPALVGAEAEAGPKPVVLPAGDIIPAPAGRKSPAKRAAPKRAVPASKRTVRGGPPPAVPVRRPARRNERAVTAKAARLEGKAGSRSTKGAHEGSSQKPNSRSRSAGSANRAGTARTARDQSRNRAGHSGARSSHARGAARRGR